MYFFLIGLIVLSWLLFVIYVRKRLNKAIDKQVKSRQLELRSDIARFKAELDGLQYQKQKLEEELVAKQNQHIKRIEELNNQEIEARKRTEESINDRIKIIDEAIKSKEEALRAKSDKAYAEYVSNLKKRELEADKNLTERLALQDQIYSDKATSIAKSIANMSAAAERAKVSLEITAEAFSKYRNAILEAINREKQIREQADFYRIILKNDEIQDICTLREMSIKLIHKEAINKLIYEMYVRRPLSEMIKRVTQNNKISGIYKITNINTSECYIGKTTDIQTRWTNHVKTALGLDGCAHTTFHTRLADDGLWNYTFEILEEVDKDLLSEKEKYYIALYQSDKLLNMKAGG